VGYPCTFIKAVLQNLVETAEINLGITHSSSAQTNMDNKKDDRFTIKIKRANVASWRALQGITRESNADEVIEKAVEIIKNLQE